MDFKIKLLKSMLLPVFMIMLCNYSFAQRTISGTITDSKSGETLIGANVIAIGAENVGTSTDIDGTYSLQVPAGVSELEISYTGYAVQKVALGASNIVDVRMTEGALIDEVVVVGYGTVKKSNTTGAVSTVTAKDFNGGVIASPEQLIQGRAAGVQITSASGEPGAGINIRIRGTSSVRNGNNPLFVVDGVPLGGGGAISGGGTSGVGSSSAKNPLNFLNPNDIESITVLKDASETAIYGSRGANGVVIITTKKGKAGQSSLNYNYSLGVSTIAKKYDILTADEFKSAWQTYNPTSDVESIDYGGSTDWQDVIFRTGISHNHNVSFGGGSEAGSYVFSLGYQDTEGIVENTGLKRLTARINANRKFMNDRLNISTQFTVSDLRDDIGAITDDSGFEGDLLAAAIKFNPTVPATLAGVPADEIASFQDTIGGIPQVSNSEANPQAFLDFTKIFAETLRGLGSVTGEYKITDDLSFTTQVGFDRSIASRKDAYSSNLLAGQGIFGQGRLFAFDSQEANTSWESYLTYSSDVSEGVNLNIIGGYSYLKYQTEGSTFQMTNFRTADVDQMINNIAAVDASQAGSIVPTNSFNNTDEIQSFYGRATIVIQDKYIVNASMRADGSTRFGSGNQYGYFPAIAAKWKLAEEGFLPDNLNELSVRASWGVTGNQEFGHALFQDRQRFGDWNIDSGGNPGGGGLTQVAFANPDLKWESTTQFGVGIDFEFGNGKLGGSLDFYNKNTNDLLIQLTSAQPAPNPFIWTNLDADVINTGVELGLNYYPVNTKDFTWNVAANIAYNKNVVKNLGGLIINTGAINGQGLTGAFAQRIAEDQPLYAFFLREFDGFSEDGSVQEYVGGDVQKFVDASPLPKWNAGLTNTFNYKDFNFSFFLTGQFGHYVYSNTGNAFFTAGSIAGGRNVTKDVLTNGEARTNAPDVSTRFLEKADFVRLQNVTLSYSLVPNNTNYISKVKFSIQGQNLALFTGYSGQDPEVNVNKQIDGVPSFGIDYTTYPRSRAIVFAANFTF